MKTGMTSNCRLPSRALVSFIIAIATVWAMPKSVRAQLYVTNRPGGGNGVVSEYNATTGTGINLRLITCSTDEIDFGLALLGNMLFVTDQSGFVGKYNATTGATVNANFITGLSVPKGIAVLDNTLFVANGGSGTVGKYDARDGAAIKPRFIMGLKQPEGLVVLGNALFVANFGSNTVGKYDARNGAAINARFIAEL